MQIHIDTSFNNWQNNRIITFYYRALPSSNANLNFTYRYFCSFPIFIFIFGFHEYINILILMDLIKLYIIHNLTYFLYVYIMHKNLQSLINFNDRNIIDNIIDRVWTPLRFFVPRTNLFEVLTTRRNSRSGWFLRDDRWMSWWSYSNNHFDFHGSWFVSPFPFSALALFFRPLINDRFNL